MTVSGGPAPRSLCDAVRAGIAFVSSDRKRYGLMLDNPVWQNTSAASWLGAGRGKPVLLASTDLLELVELCERVLVFRS